MDDVLWNFLKSLGMEDGLRPIRPLVKRIITEADEARNNEKGRSFFRTHHLSFHLFETWARLVTTLCARLVHVQELPAAATLWETLDSPERVGVGNMSLFIRAYLREATAEDPIACLLTRRFEDSLVELGVCSRRQGHSEKTTAELLADVRDRVATLLGGLPETWDKALEKVPRYRNDWIGHGVVAMEAEYKERLPGLLALLLLLWWETIRVSVKRFRVVSTVGGALQEKDLVKNASWELCAEQSPLGETDWRAGDVWCQLRYPVKDKCWFLLSPVFRWRTDEELLNRGDVGEKERLVSLSSVGAKGVGSRLQYLSYAGPTYRPEPVEDSCLLQEFRELFHVIERRPGLAKREWVDNKKYQLEDSFQEGLLRQDLRAQDFRAGESCWLTILGMRPDSDSQDSDRVVRGFEREIRLLLNQPPPSLPTVHGHGRTEGGLRYYAHPRIPGVPLPALVEGLKELKEGSLTGKDLEDCWGGLSGQGSAMSRTEPEGQARRVHAYMIDWLRGLVLGQQHIVVKSRCRCPAITLDRVRVVDWGRRILWADLSGLTSQEPGEEGMPAA
ncbi:MAG: hypothetical protein ABIK09_06655, partial [Pseudomonadota bacterium]